MPLKQLSPEAFPAWARLQNVSFGNARLQEIEGKGYGLVAVDDIETEGDEKPPASIMQVPSDLILSSASVDDYSKVDQNFKALLETIGHQVQYTRTTPHHTTSIYSPLLTSLD